MIFSWRPDVCVRECQYSSHARSIALIFRQIDAQSKTFWHFEFFEKCLWYVSSNFRKI